MEICEYKLYSIVLLQVVLHLIADAKVIVGPSAIDHFVFFGQPDYEPIFDIQIENREAIIMKIDNHLRPLDESQDYHC